MTNATKTLMLAASLTALSANAAPALTLAQPIGIGATGDVQPIAATTEKKRLAKRAPAAPTGPCTKAAGVWAGTRTATSSSGRTEPPPSRAPGRQARRRAAATRSPSNGATASPTR